MSDRAFICRCEDVTLGEIDHCVELGLKSVEEIKRYTGLGTGPPRVAASSTFSNATRRQASTSTSIAVR